MDSESSRTAVAGELGYSSVVARCSSVGERLGWEREREQGLGSGSCSCAMGQGRVELEPTDRHLGKQGCSIFRRRIHRRIGSICRMGRRSCVGLHSVDIVAERLAELAVVAQGAQLANGLRKLGI